MNAPQKGAAGGDLQIGVIEHDHGIFAAELQNNRQEPVRRRFANALAGGDAAGEDQLVDGRFGERCAGWGLAHHNLHEVGMQAGSAQQALKLQPDERRNLRWLQHDGVARDQRRQGLDGRNGERIVPGRDDADDAIRLAHEFAALGLHGRIAVRQRLRTKEVVRAANAEFGSVENDGYLSDERFGGGLAGLAANKACALVTPFVQKLLEATQDLDAFTNRGRLPLRLGGLGAEDRGADFIRRRAG
jgi:hypothetical protein